RAIFKRPPPDHCGGLTLRLSRARKRERRRSGRWRASAAGGCSAGDAPPLDARPHCLLPDVHSATLSSAPAPSCLITLSAWKRSVEGIVRPRAWAVLRLTTK